MTARAQAKGSKAQSQYASAIENLEMILRSQPVVTRWRPWKLEIGRAHV